MYKLNVLLIFCCIFIATIPAYSREPFAVNTFDFNKAVGFAEVRLGISCAYSRQGDADTNLVFCCSYSAKQGCIKVNGTMQLLHQIGGPDSNVFGNKRYAVFLKLKPNSRNAPEHATFIITERKTRKKVMISVVGECDV